MSDSPSLPGLDLDAFRRWYDGVRPGEIAGDLSGELIAGGKSNLTYTVTDGASDWIGIILNRPNVDWEHVSHWLQRSWRAVAPKRLTGLMDAADLF